ncbi:MAG: hypothetical protein ABSF52_03550 [Syntrophobacteraceae bacterium]|jgi:hypothetical protein
MKRIGVRYCGGCNPQIERSRFVDELKKKLAGDLRFAIGCSREKWELGILVCGCPVACADRPATRSLALEWIVVSGPIVDLESISENELATVVALKIKEFFEGRNPHEVA